MRHADLTRSSLVLAAIELGAEYLASGSSVINEIMCIYTDYEHPWTQAASRGCLLYHVGFKADPPAGDSSWVRWCRQFV